MTTFDPTSYRIVVQRKHVDGHPYFVGTVSEFPDVEVYEDTFGDAYGAIVGIIQDLKETYDEAGKVFPAPTVGTSSFNGRITLRVPRWLHQRLDEQARQQEVSLNSHLATLLTEGSSRLFQSQTASPINLFLTGHQHEMLPGSKGLIGKVVNLSNVGRVLTKVGKSLPPQVSHDQISVDVYYRNNISEARNMVNRKAISNVH